MVNENKKITEDFGKGILFMANFIGNTHEAIDTWFDLERQNRNLPRTMQSDLDQQATHKSFNEAITAMPYFRLLEDFSNSETDINADIKDFLGKKIVSRFRCNKASSQFMREKVPGFISVIMETTWEKSVNAVYNTRLPD